MDDQFQWQLCERFALLTSPQMFNITRTRLNKYFISCKLLYLKHRRRTSHVVCDRTKSFLISPQTQLTCVPPPVTLTAMEIFQPSVERTAEVARKPGFSFRAKLIFALIEIQAEQGQLLCCALSGRKETDKRR